MILLGWDVIGCEGGAFQTQLVMVTGLSGVQFGL